MKSLKLRHHLVCVGAGPKTIAIAAHLWALDRLGYDTPSFSVIDASGIGSNWTGQGGFTDGSFPVDTSALKDIGFPYQSRFGADVDNLVASLSFHAFMRSTNRLVPWVNRGLAPISHGTFGAYLRWVAEQIDLPLVDGHVVELMPHRERCNVSFRHGPATDAVLANAVVVTGPGDPILVPVSGNAPQFVSDGRSYWLGRERLVSQNPRRIAVVGAGQSAATVALSARSLLPRTHIEIISQRGFLTAQSGGFHENSLCSMPGPAWRQLTLPQRLDVLKRVNNGVVEPKLKAQLDADENISMRGGAVQEVVTTSCGATLVLRGDDPGENGHDALIYDHVILALGFDPAASLKRLIAAPGREANWITNLGQIGSTDQHLRILQAPFPLHVPSLAALDSGPGVALLSCLGDVAAAVISAYVEPNAQQCPCSKNKKSCLSAQNCQGARS